MVRGVVVGCCCAWWGVGVFVGCCVVCCGSLLAWLRLGWCGVLVCWCAVLAWGVVVDGGVAVMWRVGMYAVFGWCGLVWRVGAFVVACGWRVNRVGGRVGVLSVLCVYGWVGGWVGGWVVGVGCGDMMVWLCLGRLRFGPCW